MTQATMRSDDSGPTAQLTHQQGMPFEMETWLFRDVLLEKYRYAPGLPQSTPLHMHDEYQFGLSIDFPGNYVYRGARHPVPVGGLSVIHPGELHATYNKEARATPATYRMMYVAPDLVQRTTADIAERNIGLPFFEEPIVHDATVVSLFFKLYHSIEIPTSKLEQQSLMVLMLANLVTRCAQRRTKVSPLVRAGDAIQRARDYLHDNYAENIALDELAQVVGLSPFHLCRLFRREFGLSPHAYQTHVRLSHAKHQLLRGMPLKDVAAATGFYDQSHFGWHFKRLVGVTPGQYRKSSKNFLYATT